MIGPYVLGTQLLNTYFNRSHMMHNLKECFHSDVKLNTFEDFMINAARPFIVLKFVTDGSVEKDISECSFSMNKTEYRLNYHLQRVKDKAVAVHGLNYSFVGVKSLCIRSKPQNPFSMLQVVECVRQWMMNGHFYYDRTFTALTCVK